MKDDEDDDENEEESGGLASGSVLDDGVCADFDGGLAAEEVEEDGDALLAGQDLGDDGFEAMKGAAGESDFVTIRELPGDFVHAGVADEFADVVDERGGDNGPARTEMDDAADAGGVMDFVEGFAPVESGEEVIGKEGFGDPHRAVARRAREADARIEHFDVLHESELAGGDVFVARLGTEAEPRNRLIHASQG